MPERGPAVLAVCCSEPGVDGAFSAFLAERYGNRVVERVAVPGGAWWLARANAARSTKVGRWVTSRVAGGLEEALRGALGQPGLEAIELLGHEGCSWYARVAPGGGAGDVARLQAQDLVAAAREATRWAAAPVRGHFLLREGEGYVARQVVG